MFTERRLSIAVFIEAKAASQFEVYWPPPMLMFTAA